MNRFSRLALLAPLVTIAACSSAGDVDRSDETTPSSTPPSTTASAAPGETTASTPTPTPTSSTPTRPLDAAPRVGDCFDVPRGDFVRQRDTSETPVPCQGPHTSETFAVHDVGPRPDARTIARTVRRCAPQFTTYTGSTDTVSRLGIAVLGPSPRQVAAGATWLRCDVVKREFFNDPRGMTVRGSFKGDLRGEVPDRLVACTDTAPAPRKKVELSGCGNPHTAELVPEAITLGGAGADYPGRTSIARRFDRFCRRTFQEYVPVTYTYYIYVPTRESWDAGTHSSTCWARSESKNGLPPS